MARLYEVRDPVHNFILFEDFEKRLINSEPVQRLKRIKQLALTHEVYPGATHSRFEHSLGTMELATQAFDIIVRKRPVALHKLGWTELERDTYRKVLRVGALLHDIGHAPFSHAPEVLLPEGFKIHENFTEALIRSSYIQPLLNMGVASLNADQVVAVALGPEKSPQEDASLQVLQELVGGELGVDRIDYLVRDALHTGATAGRFDYHRLLNTLTVIEHPINDSPILALEAGGLHAAEALLLARYFMFLQVYFHDVRRIYDRHLVDFLSASLPGGRFPAELGRYLQYTDDLVEVSVRMATASGGPLGELASRLVGRKHYRLAYEMAPPSPPDAFHRLTEHLDGRFGDGVRSDEAGKETQTLEEGRLYIERDDGTLRDLLQESQLIFFLKPIWKARVYAREDIRVEVRRECEQFLGKGGAP
ncbi:MAG TPA: HD domain-containing protein [Dehalococcoidia bacterium]|nr:HD domain-containing protein [Dehalococcoidia bacterium]